jgi:hypothetical protein
VGNQAAAPESTYVGDSRIHCCPRATNHAFSAGYTCLNFLRPSFDGEPAHSADKAKRSSRPTCIYAFFQSMNGWRHCNRGSVDEVIAKPLIQSIVLACNSNSF